MHNNIIKLLWDMSRTDINTRVRRILSIEATDIEYEKRGTLAFMPLALRALYRNDPNWGNLSPTQKWEKIIKLAPQMYNLYEIYMMGRSIVSRLRRIHNPPTPFTIELDMNIFILADYKNLRDRINKYFKDINYKPT